MDALFLVLFSYLLGSVLFGDWIAKSKGVDLRTVGSGNVGATNVGRALGKKYAVFVFFLDMFKGLFSMLLARLYFGLDTWTTFFVGAFAVLGHTYSAFNSFRGGKGVATSFGVLLGVSPLIALLTLLFWFFVFKLKGYVSLASLSSLAFASLLILFSELPFKIFLMALVISLLVTYRHRDNISRLIQGRELGFKGR